MCLYWIYVFLQIGFIIKLKPFKTTPVPKCFDDQFFWEVSSNAWECIEHLVDLEEELWLFELQNKRDNSISQHILDALVEMVELFPQPGQIQSVRNAGSLQRGLSDLWVGPGLNPKRSHLL